MPLPVRDPLIDGGLIEQLGGADVLGVTRTAAVDEMLPRQLQNVALAVSSSCVPLDHVMSHFKKARWQSNEMICKHSPTLQAHSN